MNTITFRTADGRYNLTVKEEFLTRCPEPTKIDTYKLMTEYKLNQFLHNPKGPAILRLKDNCPEYWINGQRVTKEEGERIEHEYEFGKKMSSIING